MKTVLIPLLSLVPFQSRSAVDEALKPIAQLRDITEREAPAVRPDELMLTYLKTRSRAAEVHNLLTQFYRPQICVRASPGEACDMDQRLIVLDDFTLVIRDTAQRAAQIIATASELEEFLHPPADTSASAAEKASFVLTEYQPRSLSSAQLLAGLQSYNRVIAVPPPDAHSQWQNVDSIHAIPERNVLLIRETPQRQDEIRAFLARIDVPAPQVDVACWVIRGAKDGASSPSLPRELVDDLAKLVPTQAFELLSTSRLRASVTERMRLSSTLSGGSSYRLDLVPAAFDADNGALSLSSCAFQFTSMGDGTPKTSGFESGIALRAGEYTVLGAVGESPLYVVLQLRTRALR